MNTTNCRIALIACLIALETTAHAESDEIVALIAHPIIDRALPVAEVQAYCEPRVAPMPAVKTLAEWELFAELVRRDAFDRVYFRDALARQWRDATTRVEWLETIPGGPGYHLRKLRYEVLPRLWVPAVLYEPDGIIGRIPLHLAVTGHDQEGKAASYEQLRCINLAKRGIASLNVEWFNAGQLRGDGFAHYRLNQLDLCGVSGLAPFYLAMSRGLDVLLALPYADARRVAASGFSGGGWQTITIGALDPRVTLSNPVAGYSSFRTRARFPSEIGDSEQSPSDLATVTDYTHLTALLAGRTALLTFNAKDTCCYAAGHALPPIVDAAMPIFRLYGQAEQLRTHVNHDPGTHNYGVDNRQAFYRIVGDTFFPGDKGFNAREIPSDAEVKTQEQLHVRLPADNLDLSELVGAASRDLPRGVVSRQQLADLVKYKAHTVVAERAGAESRGDVRAVFWKLRVGETWTVPAIELVRGEPKSTVLVVADAGRTGAEAQIKAALAAGQRVLAVDPFYFGESKIAENAARFARLVAAVGDRPLGIQASQVAAVARWAVGQFGSAPVSVQSIGPRSSVFTLVAAAIETRAIGTLLQTDPLQSLHDVIRDRWTIDQTPELFCFGLLETVDVPQLRQLVGAERLR
jgi:hypothetical protein